MHVHAAALFIYPVKACAALPVPQIDFHPSGLIHGDREWIIVNAEGQATWQGDHPRLALVRPRFHEGQLVLSAPDGASVSLPRDHHEGACRIGIWNDGAKLTEHFQGFDAGDGAAALLRHTTGADLRLVRLDTPGWTRQAVKALHITTRPSLDEVNERLAAEGKSSVGMARFRPNIVLDGGGDDAELLPFIEEHLARLHWAGGAGRLDVVEKCIRCIVPNVDPDTAEVGAEPAMAVGALSTRRHPGEPAYFGIYARGQAQPPLRQGDRLEAELDF